MPVTKNDLYHFVRWKFFHTTFYSIPALRSVTDGPGDAALATPVLFATVRLTIHRRKAERGANTSRRRKGEEPKASGQGVVHRRGASV
jgi:hypothetical protein